MVDSNVPYINDAEGNPIGVFVPIEEYRKMSEPLYTREELKRDIKEGIRWAKETPIEEKKKSGSIEDLLDELDSISRTTFPEGYQETG